MKIDFACGKHTRPGYFCIDAVQHPKATRDLDLLYVAEFDQHGGLKEKIPLEDGCAAELQAMHFIEHVFRYQAPALLSEWKRLLQPGGRLILELPNIELACRNLLAGMDDQMSMWPLYGDWSHKDPYMMHKHGYTPRTIQALLHEAGFRNPVMLAPQTHGAKMGRDMRVEAKK